MLREGDQVPVEGDAELAGPQDTGPRTNRYTTEGVLRLGWHALGSREVRTRTGLDLQTFHRAAEGLCTVAALVRCTKPRLTS